MYEFRPLGATMLKIHKIYIVPAYKQASQFKIEE